MKTIRVACVGALMILALAISGCGAFPIKELNVTGINDALDEWSCRGLKGAELDSCNSGYKGDTPAARGARQLRANMVLALFARSAVARFESYSEDLVGDSTRLLGRLETARKILGDTVAAGRSAGPRGRLYEIDRVDALLSITDVIVTATRPTRSGLFNLIALSSPAERISDAPAIFVDALRDKLYLDAYRMSLEQLRRDITGENGLDAAMAVIDAQLKKSCEELARNARLSGQRCVA
jgi:hypothetical protein